MAEGRTRITALALLAGTVGGAGGGAVVWLAQGHTLAIWPSQVAYADLIAVLLTGIGILLSIVAIAVAFVAFYGFRHFKKTAESIATKRANVIANDRLQEFLGGEEATGLINARVKELVVEIMHNERAFAAWASESRDEAEKLRVVDEQGENA